MLNITDGNHLKQIYHYHMGFFAPYFFAQDDETWKKSFLEDVDGEGRRLFGQLFVKAAYDDGNLVGFIQYGRSAFGFTEQGDISADISYPIIRNFYFNADRPDAGELLLKTVLGALGSSEQVYAFFHYFGMSCFARHGKLFQEHTHIEACLKQNGFEIEHENVYYSSLLCGSEDTEIELRPQYLTKGDQQYIDFLCSGQQVGGCEVHFVNDKMAYLRWIYVNGDLTGKGIGTKCMGALKHWLLEKGIGRLDTDTALGNLIAQHYYEKNGFVREGITRSFYRKEQRHGRI